MDIFKELREISTGYSGSDARERLGRVETLWENLPEPRNELPNVYLVFEYAVYFALAANEMDVAFKWASLAPGFETKRQDLGEAEFLLGKVALAKGDIGLAEAQFAIASEKSNGRVFDGEDPKYRRLLKSGAFN